jgi:hypothetical protein
MPTSALIDNWLLQDVSELLLDGPSTDSTSVIVVARDADSHTEKEVPRGAVEIEALVNLLVDVVVRDELVVDRSYANAWNTRPSQLDVLTAHRVIDIREIDHRTPRALHAKKRALQEMCATTTMRAVQARNEAAFRRSGASEYEHFGAVLWGAAGNLGRSAESGLPYSPHPLRSHLLRQTAFREPSAADEFVSWLQHERAAVFARAVVGGEFRQSALVLPPFVVEIIDACSTPTDLIPVALQVRERYAELRDWIRSFQEAIDDENARNLLRHRRTMESVAQYIGKRATDPKLGATGLTMSVGLFGFQAPLPGPGDLIQHFGIRGTLNRLVLTRAGAAATEKLVGLLGERRSTFGAVLREHLGQAYAAKPER